MGYTVHPSEIANAFRGYSCFNWFSEDLLLQIAAMAELKKFKPGELILEEGGESSKLYFLEKGEVDVIVDNEAIARLNKRGEVLGEMGVIDRRPASATIRAVNEVECYAINSEDFELVQHKSQAQFQHLIFRMYANILTERLRLMNLKARQAEIINRDLIKAQHDLQDMNKNLEQKVLRRTVEIMTRIKEMDQTYVQPLSQALDFMKGKTLPESFSHEIRQIARHFAGLKEQIRSLMLFFQSEQNLEFRRILFVDPDKKQQLIAKIALGGTGVELDIASDFETAKIRVLTNSYEVIACDISMVNFIQFAHGLELSASLVVFFSRDILADMNKLQEIPFVNYVISRDLESKAATKKMILTTMNKILNKDFFGLEKYLSWGIDVQEARIHQSFKRAEVIEKMKDFFKKIGLRPTLVDRSGVVAEEMLMNAIYGAPVDRQGQTLFNHLLRTEPVELEKGQAALLRYACDGNVLGISVSDSFGGLGRKIIFDYLTSCYGGQAGSLNEGKGGAGRGLHQIVENSNFTIFNVQNGIRTEVICLINTDLKSEGSSGNPNVQFFYF